MLIIFLYVNMTLSSMVLVVLYPQRLPWLGRSPAVVEEYLAFLGNLVSAQTVFLCACLKMVISHFTPSKAFLGCSVWYKHVTCSEYQHHLRFRFFSIKLRLLPTRRLTTRHTTRLVSTMSLSLPEQSILGDSEYSHIKYGTTLDLINSVQTTLLIPRRAIHLQLTSPCTQLKTNHRQDKLC